MYFISLQWHNGPARQSSLASCSRAHPLQSRRTYPPSSEWQCSSVHVVILHPSRWRAILIETPTIHLWPKWKNGILQPHYYRQPGLFSFRRQSLGTVSRHISHQHRRSRFSDSVLRLFSFGADSSSLHYSVDLSVTVLFRPLENGSSTAQLSSNPFTTTLKWLTKWTWRSSSMIMWIKVKPARAPSQSIITITTPHYITRTVNF